MTTLKEAMDKLPAARRRQVEAQAQTHIAEEMSRRDLYKALGQTRATIAEHLGIDQENVSQLEQHSDLLLSTLRSCVEAMGGKLSLVAQFPDRPPVALKGIAAFDEQFPAAKTPDSGCRGGATVVQA